MTKALHLFAYSVRYAILLCLLAPGFVAAQSASELSGELLHKCDPWLKHTLYMEKEQPEQIDRSATGPDRWLNLFVSGDPVAMPDLLRQREGTVGSVIGSIATVRIPRSSLEALAERPEIWRLELAVPVEATQDTVRRHVRADAVHQAAPPLQQGLTGKGVILGVIDTGIDFRHPEFLNNDGSTRILSLVDLDGWGGRRPEGLDRGTEWNREEIDADLQTTGPGKIRTWDAVGHGTHVSGIAAGQSGIAPEADLIVVQSHFGSGALTGDVLDAASYIYRRASAEGKPCVINASLGTILHFHDGSDALSRGLESLISESPGRIFVASAGNRGAYDWHWGGIPAEADSVWIYSHAGTTSIRVADSVLEEFEVSIQADSNGVQLGLKWGGKLGQTPWRSAGQILAAPGFSDTIRSSTIAFTASSLGNGHTGIIIDIGGAPDSYYRIMVRGRGEFNAWSTRFHSQPAVIGNLDGRFRASDSAMGVGSPGIGEKVITVGSYTNRSHYTTAAGKQFPTRPATAGALSGFSSRGPRSDGLLKPDIVAPGEFVFAARSSAIRETMDWQRLSDSLFMVNYGTSMAAPVVSGAIALYLQIHPLATVDRVREALYQSATRDTFTTSAGPLPNARWGMGKLDVFRMLTGVAAHAGEIPARRVTVGVIWSRPLPASGEVILGYDRHDAAGGTILVYDRLGREVHRLELRAGIEQLAIDVSGWPAGIYHCLMSTPDATATGRIIVGR